MAIGQELSLIGVIHLIQFILSIIFIQFIQYWFIPFLGMSPSDSIAKLESVQVKGIEGKNYWERLVDIQLYSQERRKERYMLIFLWKISHGMVGGPHFLLTASEGYIKA